MFRKHITILFALLQGRKSLKPRQHQPHNYVCKDAVIMYIGQTKLFYQISIDDDDDGDDDYFTIVRPILSYKKTKCLIKTYCEPWLTTAVHVRDCSASFEGCIQMYGICCTSTSKTPVPMISLD